MFGWILNAARPRESLLLYRNGQQPIYYSDNIPVYEVWFWHSELKLWFVMLADPGRVASRGAVGFHPHHTKEQIRFLIEQWRQYLVRAGHICGNG